MKIKINRGRQKDMSKKLVSKPDVMSSSGVMYPIVSIKKFNMTHKTFSS